MPAPEHVQTNPSQLPGVGRLRFGAPTREGDSHGLEAGPAASFPNQVWSLFTTLELERDLLNPNPGVNHRGRPSGSVKETVVPLSLLQL